VLQERWASSRVVSRGRVHEAADLPGWVALIEGAPVGLLTFSVGSDGCEIVTLDSLREGRGIGSALLAWMEAAAREARCHRLWLVTTNDNLAALGFYQRRGFVLAAVYPGALDHSRFLKPEIPAVGRDGIPLRDEVELEYSLGG
jgi:GNAT superfamily N-acetyltransferase